MHSLAKTKKTLKNTGPINSCTSFQQDQKQSPGRDKIMFKIRVKCNVNSYSS